MTARTLPRVLFITAQTSNAWVYPRAHVSTTHPPKEYGNTVDSLRALA